MQLEGELVVEPFDGDKFGGISVLKKHQHFLGRPDGDISLVSVVDDLQAFFPRPCFPAVGMEIHVDEAVALVINTSIEKDLEITEEIPPAPLLVGKLGN